MYNTLGMDMCVQYIRYGYVCIIHLVWICVYNTLGMDMCIQYIRYGYVCTIH